MKAELQAARETCVVVDRSHLARLLADGPDFLDLLHRLSTGDVASLQPNQGRPTVLTSPKGRIVERLFVHHLGTRGVLSVGGPGAGPRIEQHLQRFTFAEQTGLRDVSLETCQLVLIGPRTAAVLDSVGLPDPEAHQVAAATLGGVELFVLGNDGLTGGGRSVVASIADKGSLQSALTDAVREHDGRSVSEEVIETWRVLQGIPAPGHELTEDYNPLEAGLWDAVSFDKGCYVGQEVVARLRTYDKVSRALVGLRLPADAPLPAPGSRLFAGGRDVGRITSAVELPDRDGQLALAYVKRKAIRPELELSVGEPESSTVARLVPTT